MALRLAPDEPEAGPWRAESLTVAAAIVMQTGQGKSAELVFAPPPIRA